MPVIWTGQGQAMDAIGLAVACRLCWAEAFGFVLVDEPVASPMPPGRRPRVPARTLDLFGA